MTIKSPHKLTLSPQNFTTFFHRTGYQHLGRSLKSATSITINLFCWNIPINSVKMRLQTSDMSRPAIQRHRCSVDTQRSFFWPSGMKIWWEFQRFAENFNLKRMLTSTALRQQKEANEVVDERWKRVKFITFTRANRTRRRRLVDFPNYFMRQLRRRILFRRSVYGELSIWSIDLFSS